MELNLQILKTDLKDIVTGAVIRTDVSVRTLSYPVLYQGELCPSKECLYLTEGEKLPPAGMDLQNIP